jgi:hypothetical protein
MSKRKYLETLRTVAVRHCSCVADECLSIPRYDTLTILVVVVVTDFLENKGLLG